MGTTMMLFNERAVALVILIIVITVTALIGAGVVSFMGAKQKSYPYQVQSYQAYMIAHSGVEFAVRYAHDNKDGFSTSPGTYIFAYDATNPCTAATLDAVSHWKQVILPAGFADGRGSLYISLELTPGCSCTTPIAPGCSCILHSCVKYGAAVREIRLNNFQAYY